MTTNLLQQTTPTKHFRRGLGEVEVTRPFHFFLIGEVGHDLRLLAVKRPTHNVMVALQPLHDGICEAKIADNNFDLKASIPWSQEMVGLEEAITAFLDGQKDGWEKQERAALLLNIQFSLVNRLIASTWETVQEPPKNWVANLFNTK